MHSPEFLRHAIVELLEERQQLLVLFCQLAALEGNQNQQCEQQQKLCQLLLDYAALWQFEIYNELIERSWTPEILAELQKQQQIIIDFDRLALDFNDAFDQVSCFSIPELEKRLSHLGQALASRLEAEDHILACIAAKELA